MPGQAVEHIGAFLPVDADDIESAARHQENGVLSLTGKPQKHWPA
jgi:hypothetical protein